MDTMVLSTGVRYTNLPQSYIRPESERPRLSEISDCEDVPIIDLGIADRSKIVKQICDACKSFGLFQMVCECELDGLHPNMKKRMRFCPTKEEVIDFLRSKITGNDHEVNFIFEAQHCRWDPWNLRATIYSLLITVFGPQDLCQFWWDVCGIKMEYPEWWLFLPLDRNGKRSNRATSAGFWKVTGKPKEIKSDSRLIGKKNILVFYTGTRPGKTTNWVMHEYCTTSMELDGTHPGQKPFVLCRLSCKQKKSVTDPNFNFAGTAVSSPSTAFEVQAEATSTPQIFSETIPVDCGDKSVSAHATENQLGEDATTKKKLKLEEMIFELRKCLSGTVHLEREDELGQSQPSLASKMFEGNRISGGVTPN